MEKKRLNVLIDADLIERVKLSAEEQKRTITAQVEILLEIALQAQK